MNAAERDRRALFLERDTLQARVAELKEELARAQGELLLANMALRDASPSLASRALDAIDRADRALAEGLTWPPLDRQWEANQRALANG